MRMPTLLCLVAACGPAHLGGTVDGEPVGGARDAFYDSLSVDLGPLSYDAHVVVITNFADGCEVFEEFTETFEPNCEERCEAYLEIAETYHLRGESLWSATLYANTSDGVDAEFDLDPAVGDGEFSASFAIWDGEPLQDVDACEEACKDNELLESDVEDGEDGVLTLEEGDELLRGRFEVDFGGDDAVSGSFAARPCDMENWIGI